MRWPTIPLLFLGVSCFLPVPFASAQSDRDAEAGAASVSRPATEEEVSQLRQEVAELRTLVQRLAEMGSKTANDGPRLALASTVLDSASHESDLASPASHSVIDARSELTASPQQQTRAIPPVVAGWNAEHFFLKSSDGDFTAMPIGYFNAQYNLYKGDGAPPATFTIPRARFGLQGSYGKQLDYQFLFESASPLTIRDAYLDFKPWTSFSIMGGQYRVPFSQEALWLETAYEFNSLSISAVLFPNAMGAFRAPGIDVHGSLADGRVQYAVGVFNGQGLIQNGTTNEPEITGRVRFIPWKQSGNRWLKGLALGGSAEHSRSKALANELSFNGLLTDNTYNFFPQQRINGGIQRYNGFFSWLTGPWTLRGEYTQVLERREGIGSFVNGGVGFNTLPGVVGKGASGIVTYFLTGESTPDNSMPRVKHSLIGPNSPGESGGPGWGAWQLKFRYSWVQARAAGATCDLSTIPACPLAPGTVPTYSDHTNQITAGLNWYLNYWVMVRSDLNINQLVNPSVQGILPRNYFVFLEGIQFRF
jgi:phosphate-selective porin OprO/OprP